MKIFKDGKMSDYIPGGIIKSKGIHAVLEAEAELRYPMPRNPCPWTKEKIEWLRERWVKEQLAGQTIDQL